MAAALAAGVLLCGLAPQAEAIPRVTVAILPAGTTVSQLGQVRGLAVGVLSTGIGRVPAEQTYLDISQGNRIDGALYEGEPPPIAVGGPLPGEWRHILERADSAPADIQPGLLGTALFDRDVGNRADPFLVTPAVIAADRTGTVTRMSPGPGVTVEEGSLPPKGVYRLPPGDLLIAFAAPRPSDETVPIGIAGSGYSGNLTSDSTRTDGYVLSTDIAPTILRRLGVSIPNAMNGRPIRSEGAADPRAVRDRVDRMEVIPNRRAPVVILSLVAWILVAALLSLVRPGLRRGALAWLALAFAYMPLTLLAGAAIEPGAVAEGLLVGLGAAALAALTVALVRGWWALAVGCAITVVAYAIDVMTGSELTKLSLLGPNPIFGVRFYGIGNELEALIAVMVPVGIGAVLTAKGSWGRGAGIGAFLGAGVLAALVFASGHFGADVGAAIVLPIGGAVAAAVITGSLEIHGRRSTTERHGLVLAAVIVAPLLVLGVVALIDLASGGHAHLTRSVLDAGGAGDLADIAQRRLELSADDFAQAAGNPLFWLVIAGICAGVARWRRIDAWLQYFPAARAGVIGACAAVAAGVLVNDSGAIFLVLGSLALGAVLAFAWAQAQRNS